MAREDWKVLRPPALLERLLQQQHPVEAAPGLQGLWAPSAPSYSDLAISALEPAGEG